MTGWFAPGRIEVLGKHTDYAGGDVLVCAVDRGITAVAREAARGITARTDLGGGVLDVGPDATGDLPPGHWARYLRTVVARLEANFGPLPPTHLEITSDLPPASGMSSSSALVVAAALALADRAGLHRLPLWRHELPDALALATYLACVENGSAFGALAGDRGVGTAGGSEDHTAMLLSRPGELGRFAFDPPRLVERVPLPGDLRLVVAVSGIAAEKTGAAREAYNAAAARAAEVLRRWNAAGHGDTSVAAAVRRAGTDAVRAVLDGERELVDRLDQLVCESTVCVPQAADALRRGDLAALGEAAARSQAAAQDLLGNQIPETAALVRLALDLGAPAASAFGAGFGGSVWAMVPTVDADGFADAWLERYRAAFPAPGARASALVTRPSGPARPLPA